MPEFRGESAWEANASFQKRIKRQATPNHKGVHLRQRNKKFAARLCLPGRKRQKLDLGEYTTHDAAARAYQVGAFYYNKLLDSTCEDQSFLDFLPSVPDNFSDAEKLAWVRERARQSAATIGNSERSASKSVVTGSGCSPLEARHIIDRHKQKTAAPHIPKEEIPDFKRRTCVQTKSQGLPNVELQLERNTNPLNNQAPVANYQAVPEFKMTDSILFASYELRKQGWEWTLRLRSPGFAEAGVLYSVPQGQHAAPALVMTDIIVEFFHELREQGWEIHLEPRKCDNVQVYYFLRGH